MKPKTINVLGKEYKIIYVDKPSDVDVRGQNSYWGQVDYWTRTIRIYDKERTIVDIWNTLVHELLHIISSEVHLGCLDSGGDTNYSNQTHKEIDTLSTVLVDTFTRNGWLKL